MDVTRAKFTQGKTHQAQSAPAATTEQSAPEHSGESVSFSDYSQRDEAIFFTALGALGGAAGAAAGSGPVTTAVATAGATAVANGVATGIARRGTKIAALETAMATGAGLLTGTVGGVLGIGLTAVTGMNPVLAGAIGGGVTQFAAAMS